VSDGIQWLGFDGGEIQPLLDVFINLANDRSAQTDTNLLQQNSRVISSQTSMSQ